MGRRKPSRQRHDCRMIINHLLLGVTVVRTLDAIERLLGPSESITCIDAILSGIAFLDKGREICTLQVGDEVTVDISMDREVSCFTHDGIGFLTGDQNGRINHVSESGLEEVLNLGSPISKILSGRGCAWALDEAGSVTWFDKSGKYKRIEGIEEISDVCHHGDELAAMGVFGGLYMIKGGSLIHSSVPDEGLAEIAGPSVFMPSGVLVTYRRSLDEMSDDRPENRIECWSSDRGHIYTHEVDNPVASITAHEGGVVIGDEMGVITFLEDGGGLRKIEVDHQKINLIYTSDDITLVGSWFHVYGIRQGEVMWKAEFDGMPSTFSRLDDSRIAVVCENPSNNHISIFALDPHGPLLEDPAEDYEVDERENFIYEPEHDSRFEHTPEETSELLSQMAIEVSPGAIEEEDVDLLVELSSMAKKINLPPVADAGEDKTLKSDSDGTLVVSLDGSRSYDPDGEITTWEWIDEKQRVIGSSSSIRVKLRQGTHSFTLRVTDDKKSTSIAIVTIRIT